MLLMLDESIVRLNAEGDVKIEYLIFVAGQWASSPKFLNELLGFQVGVAPEHLQGLVSADRRHFHDV